MEIKKKKKKKKTEKWIKFRHRVITKIAYYLVAPYTRWKFGVTIEKFKEQGNRQYLIVLNHQTVFDQFFVGIAFNAKPIYYLATEDIFSNGLVSKLIRYLVAPIPIKKQTTDLKAVKTCIRVVKEGGTIALAPEGNRTYSGKTEYMNPAIAPLVRKLKLPLAIFRIEGGYGVQPRWSDVIRKGKMRAYVSKVVEPEEYLKLSDAELLSLIKEGLSVNEASADGNFYHKKNAEYLERAMYVCPDCGLSVFESHDDIITCKKCGKQIRYLPTKELEGIGFQFPFHFVNDWYEYQCDFVNNLDTTPYLNTPIYQDTAGLWEVIVYKKKVLLQKENLVKLYGDRILITGTNGSELLLPFHEISVVSVLGRNKLNIYHNNKVYQLKGDKHFNALKYVNLFYHYKNINSEDHNGKFLGL